MIQVENLCRRYGSYTALDGISFEARAGEVVGLLGPNGAGKTTTMRILTGFLPPTSGIARVAGYDVERESMIVRRSVGYLPERMPLYPDMTTEGMVTFWAEMRGVRKARKAAQRALESVGLADRRNSLVRNLSKGMKQRLGIAQALVHDPLVVILDEPTIGIDPAQVIEVRQMVRQMAGERTVLFSTHILTEAEQICDRMVILNQGKVLATGTTDELRQKIGVGRLLYVEIGRLAAAEAERALKSVSGVKKVAVDGSGFVVQVGKGADMRYQISAAVGLAGGLVLELRPVNRTLEDVFLDLIGQGGAS
jgi:ABC-2 type transport system ATP-binding protein